MTDQHAILTLLDEIAVQLSYAICYRRHAPESDSSYSLTLHYQLRQQDLLWMLHRIAGNLSKAKRKYLGQQIARYLAAFTLKLSSSAQLPITPLPTP